VSTTGITRIIVAETQVPFVQGGAELHVRALVEQLQRRGYDVEKVAIPFRPQPKSELLAQAAAWRLLDLSSSNAQPVDSADRDAIPHLLCTTPAKGRVGHSSTSRGVRAVRHRVQRLRTHA
jgi:hypothetical protein